MRKSLNELVGYTVQTMEGPIGHVREFYFDDARWKVRYLVVDIGTWLTGRKVLIAPQALRSPDWEKRMFPVALTREQIRTSPDIDTDKPVARQHEALLNRHYGWEVYWAAEALASEPDFSASVRGEAPDANKGGKPFDPHLRTTRVVTGLSVEAADGRIGRVEDLLADEATWKIERLVVDARSWPTGRTVLIAPQWVSAIRVEEGVLSLRLTRQQIVEASAAKA